MAKKIFLRLKTVYLMLKAICLRSKNIYLMLKNYVYCLLRIAML